MRRKITLMLMALFALAAFAATQVLNQATRRAAPNETKVFTAGGGSEVDNEPIVSDIVLDLPTGGDITAALNDKIAEIAAAEGRDVIAGNVSINLGFMAKATISEPIVASKTVSIKGDNATIDASANAGALIKMNNEPSVALNEKGKAYEVGEFLIEGVTFKGVNSYVYDDQKIPYVYSSYTINNCVFEFTNNKSDIDCPFRFQGGAPLKFVLTNSTLYKNGSNTFKYLVKMSNKAGNAPDALVNLVDYEWQIENNTFFGVTSSTELMNNGRVANNYTKTSVTLNKNIFVDCASSSKDFLKNLFGNKYNDTDVAKFKKYESNLNTYFSDGKDVSAKQESYDRGMILTTDPQFANAAKGDFTPFVGSKQQKHQTGDPRWLTYFDPEQAPVEDVTIEMADGENINAKLYEATTDVDKLGDITINLKEGANYTVSGSIVAPKSVTIGVEGNGQATIDASALNGPMITTPAEAPAEWVAGNVEISGITVKGLKKALYASAAKNYLYDNFMIKDCVVEVAGDATTIDFTKGSVAKDINVTSSTFYAPTATTKAFYSSQSGQKATEADAEMVQTFTFEGNTMYNLAPTKNFFTHRQNSQKWLTYDVQNNIFVNCGKSGQTIKGLNGGGSSANPTWKVSGNAFNFDGEDTSAAEATGDAEEAVENSVAGVIEFTDVEAPDFGGTFTLGEGATAPAALGDDCWTITFTEATGIETVKTAEETSLENAVIYNLNGQRVDKAQKGLYIVNGKKVVIK